jgi:hypothetical protein
VIKSAWRPVARLLGVLVLAAGVLGAVLTPPGDGALLRTAAAPSALPGPVSVVTVPAVAGFPVTLDGVTEYTDAAGRAHMPGGSGADLADRITLVEKAELSVGGVPVVVRPARIYASDRSVQIAVDVDYFVRFHFADVEGDQLDAAKIDTVVVKSETGEVVRVPAAEGSWLQGNRVVGGSGAPRVRDLAWSVQEIQFAGSNVVNASQQRFVPAEQRDVDVKLLFFSMTVHMHDAFFAFPQRGSVDLEYPDGSTQRFSFGGDGTLTIPALPRGQYTLTSVGPGPRMSRPLAISRTQDIQLAFYSWLDILSVVGIVVLFAGGLAWVGAIRRGPRPAVHRHRRRAGLRRRAVALLPESSSAGAVVGDRSAG